MNEVMTWAEIEAEFDGEWVLIEGPEMTRSREVVCGTVVFHGVSKEELYDKLEELRPTCSAIRFIGKLPDNFEMIL